MNLRFLFGALLMSLTLLASLTLLTGCGEVQITEKDSPATQELKITTAEHQAQIAEIRGKSEAAITAVKVKAQVENQALAERMKIENRQKWLSTFPAGLFSYCGVGLFVMSVLIAFIWRGNRGAVVALGAAGMVTLSAYGKVAADYPQYLIYAVVVGLALTLAFYARSVFFRRATGIVCQAVEIADAFEVKEYIQAHKADSKLVESAGRGAINEVTSLPKIKAVRKSERMNNAKNSNV